MAQPGNSHAMKIEIFSDAAEVALAAARYLASVSRDAVAAQGKFVVALSGGNTPWLMLNALAVFDNSADLGLRISVVARVW